MCNEKKTGAWLPIVKKTVDAVYDYLTPHPDGITMKGGDYGKRGAAVCSELVRRGIITKSYVPNVGKGGLCCKYRWTATMGPTTVLYGSIAQRLYDTQKRYDETHKKKVKELAKKGEKSDDVVVPSVDACVTDVDVPEPSKTFCTVSTLDGFSAQELWDELKKRGYFIKDSRMAIVKTAYLD